jgi:hypothetical protein
LSEIAEAASYLSAKATAGYAPFHHSENNARVALVGLFNLIDRGSIIEQLRSNDDIQKLVPALIYLKSNPKLQQTLNRKDS